MSSGKNKKRRKIEKEGMGKEEKKEDEMSRRKRREMRRRLRRPGEKPRGMQDCRQRQKSF